MRRTTMTPTPDTDRELEEYFKWKRRWAWLRCLGLAAGFMILWWFAWSRYSC